MSIKSIYSVDIFIPIMIINILFIFIYLIL